MIKNFRTELNKRFDDIRKNRDLNYSEFGRLLGFTRWQIRGICLNNRNVSKNILKICSQKLTKPEFEYLKGKPKLIDYEKFNNKEYEIISLLKKAPEMADKIIIGLKNKIRMKMNYVDFHE